ncbi:hypothetical protein [Mycobacterium sp. SMC-8]|uniref:hypothetical protein n=1 Tax=Mycobacterium sp. SMC-8 TaxID=2857060 RepID=UPI0021B30BCF|nr:hypothetical protein [Mycobacterium sp. SMC-8]
MAVDLRELTLFVSDVDAAARFYEAIGLALYCIEEPEHPRHYDGDRAAPSQLSATRLRGRGYFGHRYAARRRRSAVDLRPAELRAHLGPRGQQNHLDAAPMGKDPAMSARRGYL